MLHHRHQRAGSNASGSSLCPAQHLRRIEHHAPTVRAGAAVLRTWDEVVGKVFDFIRADEPTHVRRGRKTLRELASAESLAEVEEKGCRLAASRLAKAGVLGEDSALTLSRTQIGELIGEQLVDQEQTIGVRNALNLRKAPLKGHR